MISFYSGTPGSGKSLMMAREVEKWVKVLKHDVISNVPLNRDFIVGKCKKCGDIVYKTNAELTVDYLISYSKKNHVKGKESQTLIVIDEAQMIFSPTAVKLKSQEDKSYRQRWLNFFTLHRHYGYDIIIISQFDKLIDPQIRCLFEYNFIHRKANNFGTIGKLLTIFRIPLFCQVQRWYGLNQLCGKKYYTYSKKYSKYYDTYYLEE